MASNELIVDDDYCKSMGEYFTRQGEQLDEIISEYISILNTVKSNAITSGQVSNALGTYISYVEKLNKQIGNISVSAKSSIANFLSQVDAADQYLF